MERDSDSEDHVLTAWRSSELVVNPNGQVYSVGQGCKIIGQDNKQYLEVMKHLPILKGKLL